MPVSVRITLAVVASSIVGASGARADEGPAGALLAIRRDPAAVRPIALPPLALQSYEAERKNLFGALAWELIPGAGSLYSDDAGGAILTWALIVGGGAACLWGIGHFGSADPANPADRKGDSPLAMPLLIGGLAAGTFGRVYGFVNAYRAAERYNAALLARLGTGVSLSVAPFVTTGADAGLVVAGRF